MRNRDNWETPDDLFNLLDGVFDFKVDAAATKANRKCRAYFGPDHPDPARRDGLLVPRAPRRRWLNPPYSKVAPWLKKAHEEADAMLRGFGLVVALVPLDPSTRWWADWAMKANRIIHLFGKRIQFKPQRGVKASSNTGPSSLLVYDGPQRVGEPKTYYLDYAQSLETRIVPDFLKGLVLPGACSVRKRVLSCAFKRTETKRGNHHGQQPE